MNTNKHKYFKIKASEKVTKNRKLRMLEVYPPLAAPEATRDQKLGGPENCQPSYLPTF
jgi:hypothetical protein